MVASVQIESDGTVVRRIRKRDGDTVQDFDTGKIRRAISGAWGECRVVDAVAIERVTDSVLSSLPTGVVDVETVQDAVEVSLMHGGYFDVAKAYILYRQKHAEARAIARGPDPGAISDYVVAAKYARYDASLGRRETYAEVVDRVESMHQRRFAYVPGFGKEIRRAFDLVRAKRVLPSMRSMQFAGPAVEAVENRLYNCSTTLIDRLDAFHHGMYLLLCGSGVGYSVQHEHVARLPPVGRVDGKRVRHHVVGDTIEGWADALGALVWSYQTGEYVEFSYHQVRPAGAPLKTSGGKAPGHLKLKDSLERVRAVLDGAQGRKLRPIECHRIMCHAADAVLSGGIRRSAMICLFSIDDGEMMNAKADSGWFRRDPWFANANNSVVLERGEVKERQFRRVFEMTRAYGEPGFYFTNDKDYSTNPCVPAGTRILTRTGYAAIESLVGAPTVVWNGIEWSTVTPRLTGVDQPIVRVHLSDGTTLDCTESHEWCVVVGEPSRTPTEKVEARHLAVGDVLARYDMPVVEHGADLPYAYTHGFWCADGHVEDAGRKAVMLYGIKRAIEPYLDGLRSSKHSAVDRVRVVLPDEMPDKFVVPLDSSISSRLDWFAGLLDGDGSIQKNPSSPGLQVSSINLAFLREVRLMLTTMGVQAKVCDAQEGGPRLLPDGRGGNREYLTQRVYRLLVNAADTHRLVRLGMKTHRLDLSAADLPPQRDARRFVTVEAVERLGSADRVYCFTEPLNHTGTFEGIVTGQCCEIGMNPVLTVTSENLPRLVAGGLTQARVGDRLTGYAFCNLTEINASKLRSRDDLMEAAQAAAFIGTLQAAYTRMPYLGVVSEELARRESLLGVGMTGMLDAPNIACDPSVQVQAAMVVRATNEVVAKQIGIRRAARTTCVKPSGTTSLLLGCVGSGHHAHHAHRYIRRIIADEYEPVFQAFKSTNPHACVQRPDGKWVLEFAVQAPSGAILKKDLGAVEFLNMVKNTQQCWVLYGTADEEHSPGLTHNVSNTVTVGPDEWGAVADYLWKNQNYFSGVSLIASTGDKDYAFAPNEEVQTEADEARWNQLVADYEPVDYSAVHEDRSATFGAEAACAGGHCEIA